MLRIEKKNQRLKKAAIIITGVIAISFGLSLYVGFLLTEWDRHMCGQVDVTEYYLKRAPEKCQIIWEAA